MRKYRKWVLTLGILAVTPAITQAQIKWPWSKSEPAAQQAAMPQNQQTAEEIARALRAARLVGYQIEIEFKGGTATLKGMVTDPRQKEVATAAASRVNGVEKVDNQLKLVSQQEVAGKRGRPGGQGQTAAQAPATRQPIQQVAYGEGKPDNQQTAEQIAAALSNAALDGYDIEIRYQNGVAILDGAVLSPEQRAAATQVVARVPGVKQVQNRLQLSAGPQAGIQRAAYQGQPVPPAPYEPNGAAAPGAVPPPPAYGHPGSGAPMTVYNSPNLPEHAWPSYAAYPNYAAVSYPKQYSASAWPYIGPFYPYPQVPLGWRSAQLEWDDGYWNLKFRPRTDKWWWFLNPHNW